MSTSADRVTGANTDADLGVAHENIAAVARLQEQSTGNRSLCARVSDAVARVAARESFLIAHVIWFAAWVLLNSGYVPYLRPFDRFPYSLLTTLVSLEAIFLTLFVLSSQNRLTQEADRRAHLDLQVNLLAEQEMTMVLRMLREVCEHHGLTKTISTPKFQELVKRTDVTQLAEQLETHLPAANGQAAAGSPPSAAEPDGD